MAPRPASRVGSKLSGSNGSQAGPSRVNGSQKKRAVAEVEDEEDEEDDDFAPVGELELEADDEDEEEDVEDSDAPSSSTSAPPSRSSSFKNLSTDEQLSKMIAKNTIKPDEEVGTDGRISNAKQGHGKLVRSKLVDGGYKREYEDVEAGYGSESSTEDVSRLPGIRVSADERTLIRSVMYQWNGTTTFLISDTM
jgi:hypothetical protein